MAKFCMSCGAANPDTANICSKCGKALTVHSKLNNNNMNMNDHEPSRMRKVTVSIILGVITIIGLTVLYNAVIDYIKIEHRNDSAGLISNKQAREMAERTEEQWEKENGIYKLSSGNLEINGESITEITYYPDHDEFLVKEGVKFNDFEAQQTFSDRQLVAVWECMGEKLDLSFDTDNNKLYVRTDIGNTLLAEFEKIE